MTRLNGRPGSPARGALARIGGVAALLASALVQVGCLDTPPDPPPFDGAWRPPPHQLETLNRAAAGMIRPPDMPGNAMSDYAEATRLIDSFATYEIARLFKLAEGDPAAIGRDTELPADIERQIRNGLVKRQTRYQLLAVPGGEPSLMVSGLRVRLSPLMMVAKLGYVTGLRLLADGENHRAEQVFMAVASLGHRLIDHWAQPALPEAGLRMALLGADGVARATRVSGRFRIHQASQVYISTARAILAGLTEHTPGTAQPRATDPGRGRSP